MVILVYSQRRFTDTRRNHFAMIRQHTGFRFPTATDKEDLENWLRQEGALEAITFPDLFERAIHRLRSLRVELPSEKELIRIVNSALNDFFLNVHRQVTQRLDERIRKNIDQLLIVPESESVSTFDASEACEQVS